MCCTFYTYRIQFSTGEFYFGVRECPEGLTPWLDHYYGSPKTNKQRWDSGDFIKGDIAIFEYWEEACAHERSLIAPHLDDNMCLNENSGRSFSQAVWGKGGKQAAENRAKDPLKTQEFSSKISKSCKDSWANKLQDQDFAAEWSEVCRVSGRAGGKTHKGKPKSESHKKALSEGHAKSTKPRPSPSEETRDKISSSMKGNKNASVMKTPEARKKHSEIIKECWAKRKRGEIG